MEIKYRYILSLSVGYLYFVCTLPNPQFIHPSSSARLYYICSESSLFSLSTVYPQIDESLAWIKCRYLHFISALSRLNNIRALGLDKGQIKSGYLHFIPALSRLVNTHNLGLDNGRIKCGYRHFISALSRLIKTLFLQVDEAQINHG